MALRRCGLCRDLKSMTKIISIASQTTFSLEDLDVSDPNL